MTSGSTSTSYSYANDRLSAITHNGFSYNFVYDAYGNAAETKVGTQRLSKNTYGRWNSALQRVTYGNNDTVEYSYNSNWGTISSIKKGTTATEATTKYSWSYDFTGTAWKHTDYVSGLTYLYDTDSIGRLRQQRVNTTATGANRYATQYSYDKNNNVSKLVNSADGQAVTTSYVYGEDNLPESSILSGSARKHSYGYNSINLLKDIDLSTDSPVNLHYNYRLSDRNAEGEETYRTTQINGEIIGNTAYRYSYDKMGNFTKIDEGVRSASNPKAGSAYAAKLSYEYDSQGQL